MSAWQVGPAREVPRRPRRRAGRRGRGRRPRRQRARAAARARAPPRPPRAAASSGSTAASAWAAAPLNDLPWSPPAARGGRAAPLVGLAARRRLGAPNMAPTEPSTYSCASSAGTRVAPHGTGTIRPEGREGLEEVGVADPGPRPARVERRDAAHERVEVVVRHHDVELREHAQQLARREPARAVLVEAQERGRDLARVRRDLLGEQLARAVRAHGLAPRLLDDLLRAQPVEARARARRVEVARVALAADREAVLAQELVVVDRAVAVAVDLLHVPFERREKRAREKARKRARGKRGRRTRATKGGPRRASSPTEARARHAGARFRIGEGSRGRARGLARPRAGARASAHTRRTRRHSSQY